MRPGRLGRKILNPRFTSGWPTSFFAGKLLAIGLLLMGRALAEDRCPGHLSDPDWYGAYDGVGSCATQHQAPVSCPINRQYRYSTLWTCINRKTSKVESWTVSACHKESCESGLPAKELPTRSGK
jgi:hypothetical protein